ncbi:thioesterase II family protein [Streptomyces sp. NPDC001848]|uniref:thioesterase II family protein n=1 Tax=Streptomyces sp. NPDC001848 TaxID=3364618 RepID=UPI0036882B46
MTVPATGLWIRRFRPAPEAPVRLLCLPYAGGAAPFYLPFARALTPRVDVLAVQYPGRQDRREEPCIESVPEMADALVDEVVSWTDRPLALFGHSMGASVAFELALRLERLGHRPAVLFASGRCAPSRPREGTVHLRDDAGLVAELVSLGGTDVRVLQDAELLRTVLPAVRSDYRAAETYRRVAGSRLATPVRALVGADDPRAPLDAVRAWADHTDGGFELRTFPGGHFYLADQMEHVAAEVSRTISAILSEGGVFIEDNVR